MKIFSKRKLPKVQDKLTASAISPVRLALSDRLAKEAFASILEAYRQRAVKSLVTASSEQELLRVQGQLRLLETLSKLPEELESEIQKVKTGQPSWLIRTG